MSPNGERPTARSEEDVSAKAEKLPGPRKAWLTDLLGGGIAGGVVGAVVAVNIVIYSGMERGYETSLPEVLQQNVLVGLVVVGVLGIGPVVGVWIARRLRSQRMSRRIDC